MTANRLATQTCMLSPTIPAEQVTLSYSSTYGTAPADKTVDEGYALAAGDLPTLTADGHVFSKWVIGQTEAVVGTVIADDTELTAVWAS